MRLGRRTDAPAVPRPRTRVLVRPELAREMAASASASPLLETGGPLFGTVQRSWGGGDTRFIVSLLGTVPPGPGLGARSCSVGLGSADDGERAASALRWLRSATSLDLLHVGDWHSHPEGSALPSRGDESTARAMGGHSMAPLWLVAVVASHGAEREELASRGAGVLHTLVASESAEMRLYQEAGRLGLAPVAARLDAEALPRLPPLPWHLAYPERFAAECRLLAASGFRIAVEQPGLSWTPELTLCLRRDGGRPVYVVTGPDHPYDEPMLADGRGRRVPLRKWSPERFLVDVMDEVS